MDTRPFLRLLSSQSHSDFVQLLNQQLQELNFKLVLKDLGPALFSPQVEHGPVLAFLMQCLAYCQQHVGELSAGIKHLLLELIPTADAQTAGQEIRSGAVQLFHEYCTPQDAKLAAKVATIFNLHRGDLVGWTHTIHAVQTMLASQSSYKAAVHLLMQFEGLDEHIDKYEVITQLIADGQENLAQQWVATLGKDYQITFVEACVALDRLKPAARAVRMLGLTAEFPNIEALYRQRSLARLVGKRLWQVALSFVGSDTALQTQLVREMVDAGELSLAEDYRKQLGLPESVVAVDPAAVAAQEASRREQYLQLDLPQSHLLFIDTVEGLAQASELLSGNDVIGLDVEWKPSHLAGMASPAAILQLATRHNVVLFDLITLATKHGSALDACLIPLFASPYVLKLGFELSGDLAKLAGSWTELAAFQTVAGVLDLRPMWIAYGLATRRQGASVRLLSAVGLSTLCKTLLGKPLDKSQQMSDWTARPLTQRQLQYAALDAYVLPKLFDRLCDELGPDRSKQLLQQHTTTVNRVKAPSAALLGEDIDSTAAPLQPLSDLTMRYRSRTCATGSSSSDSDNGDSDDNSGGSSSGSQQQQQRAATIVPVAAVGAAGSSAAVETGATRVLSFLRHRGFEQAIRHLDKHHDQGSVLTACQTAAALAVPRAAIAKTMTLLVEHEPVLVVTRGDQRVDMHKVAALLAVRRRAVRLAPDTVVREVTGFAAGGIPPVGHGSSIKVLLDYRLQDIAAAQAANTAPGWACAGMASRADAQPTCQAAAAQPTMTLPCRGLPVVAAAAVQQLGLSPQGTVYETACLGDSGSISADPSAAAASATVQPAACRAHGTAQFSSSSVDAVSGSSCSHVYLQCGARAVIQLTYAQLLELSGGRVADIANAHGDKPVSADDSSPAAATAASQQQQSDGPQLSQGQPWAPCFLLDSMLGRLCRWLRALGVDAAFVESCPNRSTQQQQQAAAGQGPHLPQQQLAERQQSQLIELIHKAAMSEGRLFLTRDAKLAARRDVGGSVYLLSTDDAAEQLTEISRHFGIRFDETTVMSRCSSCNAAAFQPITPEAAAATVPAKVMEVVQEFWQCGSCGKVFWMGPKSYAAINLLEGLFTDGKTRPTPLQSLKPGYAAAGVEARPQ